MPQAHSLPSKNEILTDVWALMDLQAGALGHFREAALMCKYAAQVGEMMIRAAKDEVDAHAPDS